jgi:hypothetical protein
MSRERFDDTLVDELERELREALTIEPSHDFAHNVRVRIAARHAPAVWWKFALPIAATCMLAVGLLLMGRSSDVQRGPVERIPGKDVQLRAEVMVKATVAPDPPAGHRIRRPTAVNAPTRATHANESEIIVPPDRALALARFLELARAEAVTEETLKPFASGSTARTLEIEPLVVAPIPVQELQTPTAATQGGADRE